MTAVYAVHRRNEALEFAKLRTLDGLSHVRCLRDNVLGCGFFGETHSPCVANWKTGDVHLLPQSPGTPVSTLAHLIVCARRYPGRDTGADHPPLIRVDRNDGAS